MFRKVVLMNYVSTKIRKVFVKSLYFTIFSQYKVSKHVTKQYVRLKKTM